MTERDQVRDAERLPEAAARQLLKRASELEAKHGSEMSVADLRLAAREAGISTAAFEQALAELRATSPAASAPAVPARPRRLARFWPAALIFGGMLAILFLRLIVPTT
jgi:hypothetical protein